MQQKVKRGTAIDLSKLKRTPEGYYVIPEEMAKRIEKLGVDLCDAELEHWIWSVGRRTKDKVVLASTTGTFYQNPDFDCIWLR